MVMQQIIKEPIGPSSVDDDENTGGEGGVIELYL